MTTFEVIRIMMNNIMDGPQRPTLIGKSEEMIPRRRRRRKRTRRICWLLPRVRATSRDQK